MYSTRLFNVTYLNIFKYRKLYDLYLHFCNIHIRGKKKKRKKKSTYQPSQFSGQKAKQTLIFLGLMYGRDFGPPMSVSAIII